MKIQNIVDLKRIREIKTKYGFSPRGITSIDKAILAKIDTPKDILNKRIAGLEAEDEFLLILLMLGKMEQVTRLDQKPYFNKKKYRIPDCLLSVIVPKEFVKSKTPLAQRMFVEIKKCKEGELDFIIGFEYYRTLRNFSDLYNLPLYFGVKFNNKYLKQWFFISGKTIEKFAKKSIRVINNRKQNCFILKLTEIFKLDMLSLWLNNHIILLRKGTIISKEYDKSIKKANLIDEKLGSLVMHTITYGKHQLRIDLLHKDSLYSVIYSTFIKMLARGNMQRKKENNKTIIMYTTDENYFIPYYHIILHTYLHLRRQFRKMNNEPDVSPEYYLNNFSIFDEKLLSHIKYVYSEIVKQKVIQPIKNLPEFN